MNQYYIFYARQKFQITDWGNYIDIDPAINGIVAIEKDIPKDKMRWKEAENYAKKLNKGGHSDWSLPTTDELKTICGIKNILGINGSQNFFWASYNPHDNSKGKWGFNFNNGKDEVYCNDITLGKGHVCCVRRIQGVL